MINNNDDDKCTDKGYCNKAYSEFNKLHDFYLQEINKLKVGNEELKEAYCNGLDEYKICRSLQNSEHRIYALETALDEIEEYIYSDCEYNDGCDKDICLKCKYCNIYHKQILQLIKQTKE